MTTPSDQPADVDPAGDLIDAATPAEFDLHGAVGVRLEDADPGDVAAVTRQLGPLRAALGREPDITIRFVDHLAADGPLRFLGHEEAGFTDTAYLVLRGRHKSSVKVAIPMDRIGGRCEIVCERGVPAIPLLIPILNLTALGNGLIPLHAGAFVHDGLGVLTIGWAKGGKSETLLAFTARGAGYVGDEWIYLDPERRWMRGLPEPMRVWDWQIRAMPGLAGRIPAGDRRRLGATRLAAAGLRAIGDLPIVGRTKPARLAGRLRAPVERQLSVQVPPDRLLGRAALPDGAALDRLVLVLSHADDDVTVEPADAADHARRATESFLFEVLDLLGHYRRFRFAFPNLRNPHLDDLETRHGQAVAAALADVPALTLRHPYPLEIPRLYEALAPRLR
jgi:hypothetical protein